MTPPPTLAECLSGPLHCAVAPGAAPGHTQFWRTLSQEQPPGIVGGNSMWLSPLRSNIVLQTLFLGMNTQCHSHVENLPLSLILAMDFVSWARNTVSNIKRTKRSLG